MPKFYFTYGMDPAHPFKGGWTKIEAPDQPAACTIFKMFHPNREGSAGLLNYAGIYSEDEFRNTGMLATGNLEAFCHERITLSRDVLTLESEGC